MDGMGGGDAVTAISREAIESASPQPLVGGFCWRCISGAESPDDARECDRLGVCRLAWDACERARVRDAERARAARQTDLFALC